MADLDSPSHSEYLARRLFGSLDGLRCISIVVVIWHHSAGRIPWFPSSEKGFLGVDMFFVISGFLIVTLLLRERERTGTISLTQFYARRTLRIFPAYYGLLAAISVLFLTVKRDSAQAAAFLGDLPWFLTFTTNWRVGISLLPIAWSLAAEEQFYLLWPPVEKFLRRAVIPLLLVSIGINQLFNFRLLDGWLWHSWGVVRDDLSILQATFTPICLGVLLAHVLHSARGFPVVSRLLGRRATAWVLATTIVAACSVSGDISGAPRLALQLLMTGLLASCVIREDHGLSRVLTWAPIRRIGAVSYGMYLYHLFAVPIARSLVGGEGTEGSFQLFVLTLAFTWLIAEVSFRVLETPFLSLRSRFAAKTAPTANSPLPGRDPRTER